MNGRPGVVRGKGRLLALVLEVLGILDEATVIVEEFCQLAGKVRLYLALSFGIEEATDCDGVALFKTEVSAGTVEEVSGGENGFHIGISFIGELF